MNENVFIYMANNNFHTIPCVFRERECVCLCVRACAFPSNPSVRHCSYLFKLRKQACDQINTGMAASNIK